MITHPCELVNLFLNDRKASRTAEPVAERSAQFYRAVLIMDRKLLRVGPIRRLDACDVC